MKISYNWLKTLINTDLTASEAAELLTAGGLEVEGIDTFESVRGGLKGLVVGKVLDCDKHPDADRLSVTRVDVGNGEPLNIVCGAPNVAKGQKVIVATVGCTLYPNQGEPFEIKKSKIRGISSEGMICAEDEIGLGTSHAGIMVLPDETETGLAAANYFNLVSDTILEIGLTPNRSDAASHLGVARDLAAILKTKIEKSEVRVELPGRGDLPESGGTSKVSVEIEQKEGCKRYSGLVIKGIKVTESPVWLKTRLLSIGLRPINNIVDITNFVLHELGQPLHAFDLSKIKGNTIKVRNAQKGEKFKTLDGVERELYEDDLVIADNETTLCLAGVFGGSESGVTEGTTSIFLESAYFDPSSVRRTSKHHSLKTDASFRFERGTDPDMTTPALSRAAQLIFEIAGGSIEGDLMDIYPEKLEPFKIGFSYTNCQDLIGKEIERNKIKNIILNLGIQIENEGSDGLVLLVPRYKSDVTREVDVIEEVMRIYGYNNVEVSKSISYTASVVGKNFDVLLQNRVADLLQGLGFSEIMCLSLTKETYYTEAGSAVKVLNPLSNDLNVLRSDMLFSGLEAINYNINRKNADLKFYEIGRSYHHSEKEGALYQEKKHLSLFVTGRLFPENPYGLQQLADLSYLKACLETLFAKCGIQKYTSKESTYSHFEYGLTYSLNAKDLAEIGLVKRSQLKQSDISQPVFYACINWEVLLKAFSKQKVEFEEIPKFPSVRRDLALLLDRSVKYAEIEALAYSTEKKLLQEVNLFDVYEGEKLGGKKSYAVSFTLLNKEATLTDKEIDKVMDKLINTYKEKLGAELR